LDSLSQYSILIVDDEANICDLLKDSLSTRGYHCVTARNAAEALECFEKTDFDVALLDVKMPGMSGVQLLEQVKSKYSSLAVIMLTAVDDVETAVLTMKAGACDYITKPFDLDRVDNAVRVALEKIESAKEEREPDNLDENVAAIEAIARGVEVRQELLDVHSEIVVQQTAVIARQMGLPEEKIQAWILRRTQLRSKSMERIVYSLAKPAQNV